LIYPAVFHTFVKKAILYMQTPEYYLKDLLYTYDCVTIPGLGGFIMQSQPSRIDREKNRIFPPSRFPSFNSLLNHDDGLLISAIARAEKISYHDSGLMVSEFAGNCKRKLSLGEKIILEGIGELSSNDQAAILFRQLNRTNFHTGVFGMKPLNLFPVTRQRPQDRLTQKPADRKPMRPKTKQPASVRWTLILSVPVVLFLLYGIIFPSSVQNLYRNYSGLAFDFGNPGSVQQPIAPTVVAKPEPIAFPVPEVIPAENKVTATEKIVTQPEKAVAPAVTSIPQTPRYYIIGGCFISEENAVKFLQDLIGRGFDAEKAGSNNRGQIRISYKSFPDKTAAISYLQIIRETENPSAWLFKY
jgi:nucleoid DNA-binding protein